MMKKEFIPYEEALALKELGFDEECLTQWGTTSKKLYLTVFKPKSNKHDDVICGDMVAAPLYQQAFRWFREKFEYDSFIYKEVIGSDEQEYAYQISTIHHDYRDHKRTSNFIVDIKSYKEGFGTYTGAWSSYQEAQDSCLRKLIEIVNQNKE